MSCIFCKIAEGSIPSNKLYEDGEILAFHDIDAKAPVHFLVIPKEHITDISDINPENSQIVAAVFERIAALAKELNLDGGYRVVSNCGEAAGQSVPHLHFHVLAGRSFSWPPG
ncbi:MAG: histidine triad nucleotide-binding protein [Oscillospiraceae bacterium]|jgi:histidine triad (HIT) family protein|nr:histidine triad nucleotide-binding protein [Oscillospiraceae bacterium]